MYSNKIHYDDDRVHWLVFWMANSVLCIARYQTLVTKIFHKGLRVWEGLNSIKKVFKDRMQMSAEIRKKKY